MDLAGDEEVLLQAARILGKSAVESSGDAATWNEQGCYESAAEGDDTHLIFGRGELDFWFILSSSDGAGEGNHDCRKSGKITRDMATDSGLRLGLTKQQAMAVLGLATAKAQDVRRHTETLIYGLETDKRTDPQKLARCWQQEVEKNPEEDHQAFLRSYEFHTLAVYVSAQFVHDFLTRLTVSWSSQY